MEVESAAVTVHSQIYIQQPDDLDGQGDFTLRDNFHKKMRMMLDRTGFQPRRVVDIGCSTGLSTLKLHNSFPSADIIGIDLSPYMIAGIYRIDRRSSPLHYPITLHDHVLLLYVYVWWYGMVWNSYSYDINFIT